jgi:phosphate starvation-inducible protein PhoH and related proteins
MENLEKRKPKGDIKFKLTLSDEQKLAKADFYEKDVNIVLGRAASGKTQFAVLTALDYYFKRHVNKIIISRPVVKNNLGFLPGDIAEKMAPHIAPIKYCMYEAYRAEQIDKMFEDKSIQILPIDFVKGTTFSNAVVIIDEFQDLDYDDFKMCLTRLGRDSKMIFTGSYQQVDRSIKNSCMTKVRLLDGNPLVSYNEFTSNHRNPVIFDILNAME